MITRVESIMLLSSALLGIGIGLASAALGNLLVPVRPRAATPARQPASTSEAG